MCCLGRVMNVGTGRDLSVNRAEMNPAEFQNPEINPAEFQNQKIQNSNISKIQNPNINCKVELNQYGLIVEEKIKWLMSQYEYVDVHNFVVMPNHFHLILEIDRSKIVDPQTKIKSLSSLLGAMKTTSSKAIHLLEFHYFAWHRSFHDHIIRDEKSYVNISNYIDNNPQKWFQDKFFKKD